MNNPEDNQSWEQELLKMLNDPRTGLKESSDTNKTRHGIFGLVRTILSQQAEKQREEIARLRADCNYYETRLD